MGGSSTGQAQANQAYNQQAAEQFYQTMVNNMFNRVGGQAAAPVSKWGNITGPSAKTGTMSTAWNPPETPLMRSLIGSNIPGTGGGKGGGGKGSSA
jgi:hypothetical protein